MRLSVSSACKHLTKVYVVNKSCNDGVIIDSSMMIEVRTHQPKESQIWFQYMHVRMLKIDSSVNKVMRLLDKTYHHTCVHQHWGWTQHCICTCRSWLWWSSCVRSHWYHLYMDLNNDKEQTEYTPMNFTSVPVCTHVRVYVCSYSNNPYLLTYT